MNSKLVQKAFRPVGLVFIVTTVLFITFQAQLRTWGLDPDVLLGGNIILFVVTAISFYLYTKALGTKSVHVMLRMMYGSMAVRMMICLIAAFIYIRSAGKDVSKGAIFGCMFLYLVYTGMEVAILMKSGKQKKNV